MHTLYKNILRHWTSQMSFSKHVAGENYPRRCFCVRWFFIFQLPAGLRAFLLAPFCFLVGFPDPRPGKPLLQYGLGFAFSFPCWSDGTHTTGLILSILLQLSPHPHRGQNSKLSLDLERKKPVWQGSVKAYTWNSVSCFETFVPPFMYCSTDAQ